MVHVQQRTLGAFEQHPPALANRSMYHEAGVGSERKQSGGQTLQQSDVLVQIGSLATAHHLQQLIGPPDSVGQGRAGTFDATEIDHSDSATAVLVLVRRADAPTGGAELLAALASSIEQLVVRHDQVGPVGDEETAPGIDTAFVEAVELAEQVFRLEHYAVPNHAGDALMQDARGYLPEHELFVSDHHGVTRVGTTLVAHHQVRPFGQHVDQLSLPFV